MFSCVKDFISCKQTVFKDLLYPNHELYETTDRIVNLIKYNSTFVSNDMMVIFGNKIKKVELKLNFEDAESLNDYHQVYQYMVECRPMSDRRYRDNHIYINIHVKKESITDTRCFSVKKQWLYIQPKTFIQGECDTCMEPDRELVKLFGCNHTTQCKQCHKSWVIDRGNGCPICRSTQKQMSTELPVIMT